jgi:DNA-3-methyladenine glycosylase I
MLKKDIKRCPWVPPSDAPYVLYHDQEWGVPLYNDKKIYEFLVLEVFQAGLSWRTVLYKRANFKKAFLHFDVKKVSKFSDKDIQRLVLNAGIIRNKAKIKAAIANAKKYIEIKKEFGSFANYMWSFVNDKPIDGRIKNLSDYKPYNQQAIAFSKDLKKRGFQFLGPRVVYAHMQATGMVNDHAISCFRYKDVKFAHLEKNKILL